jgi:endonuclease/exonuclease/phosphatase family metal-dependent hydrolase
MFQDYQPLSVLQKLCPRRLRLRVMLGVALFGLGGVAGNAAQTFALATYNVENYLLEPAGTRPVKSEASRAAVGRTLLSARADIVALQEVGGHRALEDLRGGLRASGLEYPFTDLVYGYDTNIQVAVLSRFPIVGRRAYTNEGFLLRGRRFRMARGFSELEIRVAPAYRLTLINVHLKSQRETPEAAEDEIREQEALLLRRKIDQLLRADPKLNLAVVGDLNDLKNSAPLRILLGRGATALRDTRPGERLRESREEAFTAQESGSRQVTWTHYYDKEDVYSRLDYILISSGLGREWLPRQSLVLARPDWGLASDHRAVVASFTTVDR